MTDLSKYIGEFDASKYAGNYEYTTEEHPRTAIIKVLQEHGFKPPHGIPPNKIVRFQDPTDKAGKKSGWCIYYENIKGDAVYGSLVFGSFKGDPFDKMVWSNKRTEYMSVAEKAWHTAKIEHARQVHEAETQALNTEMASEAERIYNAAPEIKEHDYIKKKKIKPYRAKAHNEFIILPIYIDEKISSLQYIKADGEKRYLPGGAIRDGYCAIPGDNSTVYVCEGWATGCSIREVTGNTVYVSYQSSNIYGVTAAAQKLNQGSMIVIAADNDRHTDGNPGMAKATTVGQALGVQVIVPIFGQDKGTDFNDVHVFEGLDVIKRQLEPQPVVKAVETAEPENHDIDSHSAPYGGFMQDVVSFYNVTSGMNQPGFALQTAMALASFYCSRYFMTDQKNTSTLYFLNIGQTGTGKEHIKNTIEEIMHATGDHTHIGGDGFTSDGALIGMLMHNSRSVVCIDEWGRYMSSANSAGMAYQKSAVTCMMEAITRTTGILRAKGYSTFGLTQEQIEAIRGRFVICPALCITANTTPETFYENITINNIKDGFLGRFVMYESKAERQLFQDIAIVDVPQSILNWVKLIKQRTARQRLNEDAAQKPEPLIIPFSEEAKAEKAKFAMEILRKQRELDPEGLGGLFGRVTEFAMRMSLICALSRDPMATSISGRDMAWACEQMKQTVDIMETSVREFMTGSAYDASKREVLDGIKRFGGLSWKDMQVTMPFMKHKPRDLKEILASLVDGEQVTQEAEANQRGRPTMIYKAISQSQD
jgi:phage/plasmid primase-like uncharacterized protein